MIFLQTSKILTNLVQIYCEDNWNFECNFWIQLNEWMLRKQFQKHISFEYNSKVNCIQKFIRLLNNPHQPYDVSQRISFLQNSFFAQLVAKFSTQLVAKFSTRLLAKLQNRTNKMHCLASSVAWFSEQGKKKRLFSCQK